MRAVVVFLREVRDALGISQSTLADVAGLSLRQINRWETGAKGGKIGTEAFVKIIAFLDVPIEYVKQLLLDTKATDENGKTKARRWLQLRHLTPEQRALLEARAETATDEDLLAMITLFEQMRTDVTLRRQFMAYGRGLLDAQRNGGPAPEPPPQLLPRQRPPGDSDE